MADLVIGDLHTALRRLGTDRGFTLVAILALAIGIGVNNTFFTLVNAICLRGPIADPAGLVHIGTRSANGAEAGMSYADFVDARSAVRTLSDVAAYISTPAAVADDQHAADAIGLPAERVTGAYVTANALTILESRPILGRGFTPNDNRPGAQPVVIVAAALWRSRYAADPGLVGRAIRINSTPTTVIGIMPDGFRFPADALLWMPMTSLPGLEAQPRVLRTMGMFGRLGEGSTLDRARAEMAGVMSRLAVTYPRTNTGITATVVPINDRFTPRVTDPAWLAFITAGVLVLLIACANVANLLLARSLERSGEMAIRASLGAGRSRIVRQLLLESACLASLGGVAGLALSLAGNRLLATMIPEGTLPSYMSLTMDGRVLAVLAAVSLAAVFLAGLVPAVFASRLEPARLLNERSASTTASGARRWTAAFLTAEFALTFVLLAVLAIDLRSFSESQRRVRVVDTTGVMIASITLPPQRYQTPEVRRAFYDRLAESIEGAGVPIAFASWPPYAGGAPRQLEIDGRSPIGGPLPTVTMVVIGSRYFDVLGVQGVAGREFTDDDGRPGQMTAIINERLKAMFFPDDDPIGERIRLPLDVPGAVTEWMTIVGVAPTIPQNASVTPAPIVYVPHGLLGLPAMSILARGPAGPADTASILREQVRRLDPDLPLARVSSMEQVISDAGWNARVSSALIRSIALIGLILAVVGLYAVTSYTVSRRTREIGLRVALGARARDVRWLVIRRVVVQLSAATLVGVICTVAWDRLFAGGAARVADPALMLAVTSVILAAGCAAALVPANRAARMDPVAALRTE